MKTRSLAARLLAIVLALGIAAPQLAEARYQPTSGRNAFTEEQEIQLGRQAEADTFKKMPILPDSDPLARYVSRLGMTLASHAPGYRWPYRFHVVNQKDINAFALPGGAVFVNVGTIQAAQNEAQLAGVLAHEISHVVERHATRAYTKEQPYAIGAGILGAILGMRGGALAGLGQLAVQFGVGSYFLKNSRDNEREADLVGTDIMYDSGYDPRQLAVFFENLESQGGSRTAQFLSDHPDPGNRAAAVAAEARTLPSKQLMRDSQQFQEIKREVGGMRPMTSEQIAQQQKNGGFNDGVPANGGYQGGSGPTGPVARGDVMPSGNFRTYRHQDFRIDYPDNWQVMTSNQGGSVTIAPPAGVINDALVYGAIIGGYQPQNARSLDDATNELYQQLKQGNPNLRPVGQPREIAVGGIRGESVDLVNDSAVQDRRGGTQRERDWLVTVPYQDGSLLYIVFVAPDQDFNQMQSAAFQPMLRSLRLNQ